MALSKTYSVLHFVVRLLGVTGFFAGIVGLVFWLAIDLPDGMYIALGGGAALLLALLFEVPGVWQGLTSRRGAMGSSVAIQIGLAVVLLAGVNAFSYLHYKRFDLTRDRLFTLDETWRKQLGNLSQDTTIVIYQRHASFGQGPENPPDNYDAAAERKIIEKVRDLADLFQDLGPRFRVELLDIHDDNFEDRMKRYKENSPKLAEAIDQAKENSVFFYARPEGDRVSPKGDRGKDTGFVQILSFNDVLQLDKKASHEGTKGYRNLVLRDQGVAAFAGKVLNIQEKRPKVGVLVSHPFLGVDGPFSEFNMAGIKKALQARGMDYVDIVLKDMTGEFVVFTHDEHEHERLEGEITTLEEAIEDITKQMQMWLEMEKDFTSLANAALNTKYFYCDYLTVKEIPGPIPGTVLRVTDWEEDLFSEKELEDYRQKEDWVEGIDYKRKPEKKVTPDKQREYLEENIRASLNSRRTRLKHRTKALEEKQTRIKELNVERLNEQKRLTDFRAKLNMKLAECDMLLLPRWTINEPASDQELLVPYKFHKFDEAQVEAIKDFLKAGKPALFCLGPAFNRSERGGPKSFDKESLPFEADRAGDDIDALLRDLGIESPSQAILHDSDVEAWVSGMEAKLLGRKSAEVPSAVLDRVALSTPKGKEKELGHFTGPLQPVRESLLVASRGISKDAPKDLKLRFPRPVYVMKHAYSAKSVATSVAGGLAPHPLGGLEVLAPLFGYSVPDESAVILATSAESWNEDYPFPKGRSLPRPPEEIRRLPGMGTWGQLRRGPFPVAVTRETTVPSTWLDTSYPSDPAKLRVCVIGDGTVFKGDNLSPMRERLLLDSTNWLLSRDDLLLKETAPWAYLRVAITDQEKVLWGWAMWLGLPLVFVYLGLIVTLKRRMR